MSSMAPIVFIAMSNAFVLTLIYYYLYIKSREKYLGIWTLGWAAISMRFIFDFLMFNGIESVAVYLVYQILSIFSSLFLLWGTCVFTDKRLSKWWLTSAVASTILSDAAIMANLSLSLSALPTATFFGTVYFWTGLVFFRSREIEGIGKYISGYALIVSGIHHLDFPFLRPLPWFAPWGYSIDAVLRLIIAIGILLVYFQKTRQELSDSEGRFRLLAENARDLIYRYRVAPTPGFDYVSPSSTAIIGYTPEEHYADPDLVLKIIHPEDRTIVEEIKQSQVLPGQSVILRWIRKDGTIIWTEQSNVPIYDQSGNIVAIEGIARDITERVLAEKEVHKAEKKARRAERVASLATLSAGMAHEINQPLNSLKIIVDGLLFWHKRGRTFKFEDIIEELKGISAQADRIDYIIKAMRSMVKDEYTAELAPCDMNTVVQRVLSLIKNPAVNLGITLKIALASDLPPVMADESRLEEMVINLVVNAMQALEEVNKQRKEISVTTLWGENIILEISDNATGISEKLNKKMFDPFFTTREIGKGMGLGLSVVLSVVTSLQGKIEVMNNEQGGATFRVVLPVLGSVQKTD